MSIKSGANMQADDDDLIIDVEDEPDFVLPPQDEELEEEVSPMPEASTTPDEEDNAGFEDEENDAAPPRRAAPRAELDDDEAAPDPDERLSAVEREKREIQASALLTQADMEANHLRYQISASAVQLQLVADRIENAYAQLQTAEENGDTVTKIQLQRAISSMENIKAQIENARAQFQDPDQIVRGAQMRARQILEAPLPGKQVGAGIQARNAIAVEWAGQNKWMQSNAEANQFVIAQSNAMVKDGWKPDKRGFYAELSRRVKAQFPNLKVTALQAKKGAAVSNRQRAVAPTRPSSGDTRPNRGANASRFTLTADEAATMRRFNLDPKNKDHQRAWAKTRINSAKRMAAS